VPPGDRLAVGAQSRVIVPAAPPPPPDHRARNAALVFAGLVIAAVLIASLVARARRER
jgi:membrane-anchored mycosin MYCP